MPSSADRLNGEFRDKAIASYLPSSLSPFTMPHVMDKYRHGESPYALVTGATHGIGRALAFELASMNFNLVLHSRDIEKLKTVQHEILAQYSGTHVVCIAQDCAKAVPSWSSFLEPVKNLRITVLINNVGVVRGTTNSLDRQNEDKIEETIRVNTIFPTQLTKNILPILIANSPAIILNIGSAAELSPWPLLSVYSGTKSYLRTWSTSLRNELRLLGRDVECKLVMTSGVATRRPVTFWRPSPEDYATSLLSRAGSSGPVYYGYWRHAVESLLVPLMPWMPLAMVDNTMKRRATNLVQLSNAAGADDVIPLKEFR